MIDSMLDGSMRPVIHTGKMPWITLPHLGPIENHCDDFFQAPPSPARFWAEGEAARLMKAIDAMNLPGLMDRSDEPTIPHPLLGVTAKPTMIDNPIDLLVRELRGWRRHEIPGGWVLDILPRSVPEGWTMDAGVIQKRIEPIFPWHLGSADFPGHFFAWSGERARMVGTFDRQSEFAKEFLQEPISCPDGHRLSGKMDMNS